MKGKANRECLSVLAKWLQVKVSHLEILAGHSNRIKAVKVAGDPHTLKDRMGKLLQEGLPGS